MMKRIAFALLGCLFLGSAIAQDIEFGVEWDPVDDSRVGKYVVGFGSVSFEDAGVYDNLIRTPDVTANIPDLGFEVYYVAVKACKADESLCSEWSKELVSETPIGTPGNLRRAAQN